MSDRYTSDKDKAALFLLQKGRCKKCGVKLSLHYRIDHIQPLSRDGTNVLANKQILCIKCHDEKTFHPRSKATTLGSDVGEAAKTVRLVKAKSKKKSSHRWPKRKFRT